MLIDAAVSKPARDPASDAALEDSFLALRNGQDPSPFYRILRERNRIYYAPDRGMWVLTGYQEVEQVLRSPAAQLQYAKRMDQIRPNWRERPASALLEDVIAFVDGDAHQKIRKALQPSWTKAEMERLRPALRDRVERLIDGFIAAGGGNFYEMVALPLAEETIFRMFGMEEQGAMYLRRLVDEFLFVHDYDATPEQLKLADQAALAMREFWKVEYIKKAAAPGDDMLSKLASNPALSIDEGMRIAESVYVGGFHSVALTATTGLWILLNHPAQMAQARCDPAALEQVPDEALRMAAAVPMTLRVATDRIAVGDYVIEPNELIAVGLLAANLDPDVFPDPDRFDLSRPRPRLMSFSTGVHACLGHFLARMELFELYRAILERVPRLDIVEARFRKDRQVALGMDRLMLAIR